jgi:hypothetical protein
MIPMIRPIDEIDPIPTELKRAEVKTSDKPSLEWLPVKDREHFFVNAKGQMRYAPPMSDEPAEPSSDPVPDLPVANPLTDGWIAHTPGDPMPCGPETMVYVMLSIRNSFIYLNNARFFPWRESVLWPSAVVAWKPYKPYVDPKIIESDRYAQMRQQEEDWKAGIR